MLESLEVKTLVFPVPAPANTSRGPLIWFTASFCLEFRLSVKVFIFFPYFTIYPLLVRKIAIKQSITVMIIDPLML